MTVFRETMTPAEQESSHLCEFCRVVHCDVYGAWCRAERQRLFPSSFERWEETEQARHSVLDWQQQQAVWAQQEAWEAFFDGQMTLEQAREYVGRLEPLPRWPVMAGAWSARARLAEEPRPVAVPEDDDGIERAAA